MSAHTSQGAGHREGETDRWGRAGRDIPRNRLFFFLSASGCLSPHTHTRLSLRPCDTPSRDLNRGARTAAMAVRKGEEMIDSQSPISHPSLPPPPPTGAARARAHVLAAPHHPPQGEGGTACTRTRVHAHTGSLRGQSRNAGTCAARGLGPGLARCVGSSSLSADRRALRITGLIVRLLRPFSSSRPRYPPHWDMLYAAPHTLHAGPPQRGEICW